jgi:hypothetical protein
MSSPTPGTAVPSRQAVAYKGEAVSTSLVLGSGMTDKQSESEDEYIGCEPNTAAEQLACDKW